MISLAILVQLNWRRRNQATVFGELNSRRGDQLNDELPARRVVMTD